MKRQWAGWMLAVMAVLWAIPAWSAPAPEQLRQTIRDYIQNEEKTKGAFTIEDKKFNKVRTLSLVRVHERVGKTGNYYYSCTDMKDAASKDELDLDFDISDQNDQLKVVDIRIHKDNGQPRYTYDQNDNMIPVA